MLIPQIIITIIPKNSDFTQSLSCCFTIIDLILLLIVMLLIEMPGDTVRGMSRLLGNAMSALV